MMIISASAEAISLALMKAALVLMPRNGDMGGFDIALYYKGAENDIASPSAAPFRIEP